MRLRDWYPQHVLVVTLSTPIAAWVAQVWENNMGTVGSPTITKVAGKAGTGFTRVSFSPDLERFGVNTGKIPRGTLQLMHRRVYDIAGCIALLTGSNGTPVQVHLNGKPVPIREFEDYVHLFPTGGDDTDSDVDGSSTSSDSDDSTTRRPRRGPQAVVTRVNKHLEIGAAVCDHVAASGAQASSVSFVNGIATPLGGTHVDVVSDLLTKKLVALINKRNPGRLWCVLGWVTTTCTDGDAWLFATDILARPALVKAHVRVFVNCLVPNPAFDSQSKERLATPEAALGFNVRVTDAFAAAVADAGVEAAVVETLKAKDKAVRVGGCMFVHHWRSSHLFMPVDFAQGHSGCRQKVKVHPEARGC